MTSDSHQKIVGFDIAVNEVLVVHIFDAANHLIGEHKHGLHCKLATTKVEQILETRSEQIHNENVVAVFLSKPSYVRNSDASLQNFV